MAKITDELEEGYIEMAEEHRAEMVFPVRSIGGDMTKQEKIREGLDKVIYDRIMSFLTEDEWKDVVGTEHHPKTALCDRLTTEVLTYLASQGVVIKADGTQNDMGYENLAVEPLI